MTRLRLTHPKDGFRMMKRLFAVLGLLMFCVIGILAQTQTPITVAGVVNAASFAQGPVAPGSMISIFGSGLATKVLQASSLPLPTILDGTTVTVGALAVPLFFVSP